MDRAGREDVLKRSDRKEVRVAVCPVQEFIDARDFKGGGWRKVVPRNTLGRRSQGSGQSDRPAQTAETNVEENVEEGVDGPVGRAGRRFRSEVDRLWPGAGRAPASALKSHEVKPDSEAKIGGRRAHELQIHQLDRYCGARSRGKALDDRIGCSDGLYSNASAEVEVSDRHALEGNATERGARQGLVELIARVDDRACVRDTDGQHD